MAGRLILVKHAQPLVTPGEPPSTWPLSEEGRLAAAALAHRLIPYDPARLIASPQPKAHATAEAMGAVLGLSTAVDPRLEEQRAETTPFLDQVRFEALVEKMLLRPDELMLGEETGAAARARFASAIEPLLDTSDPTTVVVAHGRVITLWVAQMIGLDPLPLWQRLGLPSAVILDLTSNTIEAIL